MAHAQQALATAGYKLTATSGDLGGEIEHTYTHPQGHEIKIRSKDGQSVSGVDYKVPKPQPVPGQTPFKSDMSAYTGGQEPVTGVGSKSLNKGIPMGPFEQVGGMATFCDYCHRATGKWTDFKGLKACRTCFNRLHVARVWKGE